MLLDRQFIRNYNNRIIEVIWNGWAGYCGIFTQKAKSGGMIKSQQLFITDVYPGDKFESFSPTKWCNIKLDVNRVSQILLN